MVRHNRRPMVLSETSQITWLTMLISAVFYMLQWVVAYTIGCALCGNPPEPAAMLCSVWSAAPGAFLLYLFREAKGQDLRLIAICLAIGFVVLGATGGVVAAASPVRNWDLRLPRSVPETAADVILATTFGTQLGMLCGALFGLMLGHATTNARTPSTYGIERLW